LIINFSIAHLLLMSKCFLSRIIFYCSSWVSVQWPLTSRALCCWDIYQCHARYRC